MIARIDHVAIAVRDYDRAFRFFTDILGAIPGASAEDDSMKYRWQIMSLGDLSRIELLKATGDGSFLEGFLAKREGGVHHITLQTSDIHLAAQALAQRGIPYFGLREYGDAWKELFIHPRDAFGVLIQIAEFNPDDWIAKSLAMPRQVPFEVKKESQGVEIAFPHPGGGTVKLTLGREQAKQLADEIIRTIK